MSNSSPLLLPLHPDFFLEKVIQICYYSGTTALCQRQTLARYHPHAAHATRLSAPLGPAGMDYIIKKRGEVL